jgi:protein-tyrosine-phosphatase
MAASLATNAWGQAVEVQIAALNPGLHHPLVTKVLQTHGVTMVHTPVQKLSTLDVNSYDVLITLSGIAEEEVPEPGRKTLKFFWNLPNPSQFRGTDALVEEMFDRVFIEIRDNLEEIKKYVITN